MNKVSVSPGEIEVWSQGENLVIGTEDVEFVLRRQPPHVILSSPLGFDNCLIYTEPVAFPTDLTGMVSYVGHPSTRQLLEALGATSNASNNGAPGKYDGPKVGESFLAVPLANNSREGGWTNDTAIESVARLSAKLCTRVA